MPALSKLAVVVGVEAPLRSELGRWLAGCGIDSVYLTSESELTIVCADVDPDLIILADGCGLRRLLDGVAEAKILCRSKNTRVMVCIHQGDAKVLSAAVAVGADECLVAPFDADLLKFKLEQTGVLSAG